MHWIEYLKKHKLLALLVAVGAVFAYLSDLKSNFCSIAGDICENENVIENVVVEGDFANGNVVEFSVINDSGETISEMSIEITARAAFDMSRMPWREQDLCDWDHAFFDSDVCSYTWSMVEPWTMDTYFNSNARTDVMRLRRSYVFSCRLIEPSRKLKFTVKPQILQLDYRPRGPSGGTCEDPMMGAMLLGPKKIEELRGFILTEDARKEFVSIGFQSQ